LRLVFVILGDHYNLLYYDFIINFLRLIKNRQNYNVLVDRSLKVLGTPLSYNTQPIIWGSSFYESWTTITILSILAEDTGFEPVEPFSELDGLANRWFKPLTQPSIKMVLQNGIEPLTLCSSGTCSTNWAIGAYTLQS
jgi:hypothetical protein